MSGSGNRWSGGRKPIGNHSNPLSIQQQTLLAAVPRWKREWVTVKSLDGKPSTSNSSSVKVRKWVIDTSVQSEVGTEEEMIVAATLLVQTEGDALGTPNHSGSATPQIEIEDGDHIEIIEPKKLVVVVEEIPKPHPLSTEVMLVDSEESAVPVASKSSNVIISAPAVELLDTPMMDSPILPSPLPESILSPINAVSTPPITEALTTPFIPQNPSKPETGPAETIVESLQIPPLPPVVAAEAPLAVVESSPTMAVAQELVDVDMGSAFVEEEVVVIPVISVPVSSEIPVVE